MIDPEFPNLLEEGKLSFTEFDEGGFVWFTAKEPVIVQWSIWKDTNTNNMRYAHITFDFGMSYERSMEMDRNFLLRDKNASFEEKVRTTVLFDVMHALDHCDMDPNYTPFHWAIKGWLMNRLERHERNPNEVENT